jgi:hypothetical protein
MPSKASDPEFGKYHEFRKKRVSPDRISALNPEMNVAQACSIDEEYSLFDATTSR